LWSSHIRASPLQTVNPVDALTPGEKEAQGDFPGFALFLLC